MKYETQLQLRFFNPDGFPSKPSEQEINDHLADPNTPLNKVITSEANEGNIRTLKTFAFNAFGLPNHSCRGMSFAIYASSGQGKTYIVRQFAETIGIPFVFVQSDALSSTYNLFQLICETFAKKGIRIVEVAPNEYQIPPCILFFDEAHALSKSLMQGGLLNGMEYGDGWMKITTGTGKNTKTFKVDCREICWVGATTEEGKLFDAFAQRLGTTLLWHPAGPKEIAEIIKLNNPSFPEEACEAVAHYRKVPRLAKDFARVMEMTKAQYACDWQEAARHVADNLGLDEFGMARREVKILEALGQRPISKANLPRVAGCKMEALETIILPPLMAAIGDGPFVVSTHKGMTLTKAGLSELDRRGISHAGEQVTVEYMDEKRLARA